MSLYILALAPSSHFLATVEYWFYKTITHTANKISRKFYLQNKNFMWLGDSYSHEFLPGGRYKHFISGEGWESC